MAALFDNFPALAPPPGVVPNFTNPYTTAPPVRIAMAVMVGVATAACIARIFTKAYVMRQFQAEDYLLILGWCFFIVFCGFIFAQMPFSIGRHQWDVNLSQMMLFLKYLNYTEMFYGFCMLFTKLAILFQIKRIFIPRSKRSSTYWLTVSLMVLGVLYYVAAIVIEIAQCIPRDKIWNPLLDGTCVDNNANVISTGAFNLGYDILMFALPIYAILRLKMTLKRKLGICAVFATGLLAVISSFLRLYYSIQALKVSDITFGILSLAWTACLEGTAAILVACSPTFPRLYQFLARRDPNRSSRRSGGSSGRPLRPSNEPKLAFDSSGAGSLGASEALQSGSDTEYSPRRPLPMPVAVGKAYTVYTEEKVKGDAEVQYRAEVSTGPMTPAPVPEVTKKNRDRERERERERERDLERQREREREWRLGRERERRRSHGTEESNREQTQAQDSKRPRRPSHVAELSKPEAARVASAQGRAQGQQQARGMRKSRSHSSGALAGSSSAATGPASGPADARSGSASSGPARGQGQAHAHAHGYNAEAARGRWTPSLALGTGMGMGRRTAGAEVDVLASSGSGRW